MIKLIASDLDGTLLYGRGNSVSEEMFEMIREMKKKGIVFAAASGRQYHNLKKLFAPVWQDMAFICENGAAVFYEDQLIAEQVVPKEELLELVYMIDADERTEVALSSPTTTYVRPKTQEYVQSLIDLGNHVTILKEWEDVTEPCVKLAWYEKGGVEHRVDYWSAKVKPPAKVVTSGTEWLDILYPNGHKGVGIQVLQEHFGLKKEEMAAFGDNYNDMTMIGYSGFGVAMANGEPEVKKIADYVCESNDDDGVARTIEKYMLR